MVGEPPPPPREGTKLLLWTEGTKPKEEGWQGIPMSQGEGRTIENRNTPARCEKLGPSRHEVPTGHLTPPPHSTQLGGKLS